MVAVEYWISWLWSKTIIGHAKHQNDTNFLFPGNNSKGKYRQSAQYWMHWWAKIHLHDEFPKIHRCWYSKDWDKCNNEFYLYLPKIGWNPFYRTKCYITFFEEINLTRKENVLRNPKPTTKKKYKEHLKKVILNIAETMNDFLPDLFSFFTDEGK